jgi:branched-chain amino acid transport system substrate-binding protein
MQINDNGGVNGHKIRLIEKDDQASVADGMTIAQSFAENKEMAAVIGHRNSFVSIPASRIYQEAGLVMISPASTSPDLTKNGYKNVFRSIPSDDQIAAQLASYAVKQGHQRMVIFYAEDSYGTGLANSFEDHANKNGITIVDRISYYGGLKDLNRLKEKWLALDFDGVFVADSLPEGAEFIADAGRAGEYRALYYPCLSSGKNQGGL